jgi:hypothetical protein
MASKRASADRITTARDFLGDLSPFLDDYKRRRSGIQEYSAETGEMCGRLAAMRC